MSGIFKKMGIKKEDQKATEKKAKKDKTKKAGKVGNESKAKSKTKKTQKRDAKVKNIVQAHKYIYSKMDTEKSAMLESQGKYEFIVAKKANKKEIKKSIEGYYNVDVTKVAVMNFKPKKVRFGLKSGVQKGFKKAIISLMEGQSISIK